MGMVVASEDAMRHPVGNQIDFAAISAMEHFFGQVPALVIMHRMVHANDTFHLVRERHQVVRHNHNRHGFAKIRKHVVKSLDSRHIDIVGGRFERRGYKGRKRPLHEVRGQEFPRRSHEAG